MVAKTLELAAAESNLLGVQFKRPLEFRFEVRLELVLDLNEEIAHLAIELGKRTLAGKQHKRRNQNTQAPTYRPIGQATKTGQGSPRVETEIAHDELEVEPIRPRDVGGPGQLTGCPTLI